MAQVPNQPLDGETTAGDPRAEHIGALLNEYLDLRASGSTVLPEEYIRRHPDYADELKSHFAALGIVERLTSSPHDGTVSLDAANSKVMVVQGPTGGGSGSLLPTIQGYDVLREIGRGGMGIVYKAVQRSTQRVVALKLLMEGPFAAEANRKRFEREVALAAQLRHPNIVPIYDSGANDGRMYYAMEYIHGKPLNVFFNERKPSIAARLAIFSRICQAVSHAHQRGVIHRDLKPSNVLIDAETHPYVHDFGLAKSGSVQDVMLSMTAQLVGTPAYMSPEQVAGDPGGIDMRSDIYSLGVILFEILTGESPYDVRGNLSSVLNNIQHADPRRPSKLNAEVSDELETIVLKALAKKREERYQSVTELGSDVDRFLSGDPIQARPATAWYLLRKLARRHRNELVIASLSFVVLMSVIAIFSMRTEKERQADQIEQIQQRAMQLEQENEALKKQSTRDMESALQNAFSGLPELEEKTLAELQTLAEEAAKNPNLRTALQARLLSAFGEAVRGQTGHAGTPSRRGTANVDNIDGETLERLMPLLLGSRGRPKMPTSAPTEQDVPLMQPDAQ